MQFLKTLLWVILAVAFVIFAVNNWVPLSIKLWGGLRLDAKLPIVLIAVFAIGFLPPYLLMKTTSWRLRKRVATLENERLRAIAEHSHADRIADNPQASFDALKTQPTVTGQPETGLIPSMDT